MPVTSEVELRLENGRSLFRLGGRPFHMLAVSIRVDRWWLAWEKQGIPPAGRWEQLRELFRFAKDFGFNTVSLPLLWRWLEPQPARYDTTWLARYADLAREFRLKINLQWYGQNYTGENYPGGAADSSGQSLVPDYIYGDDRFQKVLDRQGRLVSSRPGRQLLTLCPGDGRVLTRERRAFATAVRAVRALNGDEPIYLNIQLENDPSIPETDRCYCPHCNRVWAAWAKTGASPRDFTTWQFARVISSLTNESAEAGPPFTILCNARHSDDNIGVFLREAPRLTGIGLGIFDFSIEDCLRRRGGLLKPDWPAFVAENGVAFQPLTNLYKAFGELGLAGFGLYQLVDDPFYPAMAINKGLLTVDHALHPLATEVRADLCVLKAALAYAPGGAGRSFHADLCGEVLRGRSATFSWSILPGPNARGLLLQPSTDQLVLAGQGFLAEITAEASLPRPQLLAGEETLKVIAETDTFLRLAVDHPQAIVIQGPRCQ